MQPTQLAPTARPSTCDHPLRFWKDEAVRFDEQGNIELTLTCSACFTHITKTFMTSRSLQLAQAHEAVSRQNAALVRAVLGGG